MNMLSIVKNKLDVFYKLCGGIAAILIGLICLLVSIQVVFNFIDRILKLLSLNAIGLNIPSYSDFTGFFLAGSSFLALSYAYRSSAHIRVNLFLQNVPLNLRHFLEIFCVSVALFISAYFCYYTALLVYESYIYNDLSHGTVYIPLWIPQFFMLVGIAALALALIEDLFSLFLTRGASYQKTEIDIDEIFRGE